MSNIAGHLKDASDFIQRRGVPNSSVVDKDYGGRTAKLLEKDHVSLQTRTDKKFPEESIW